jgi:dolichyl-phosphate-mannose-protein mannosyltransferase
MGPGAPKKENGDLSPRRLRNPVLVSQLLGFVSLFVYLAGIGNPPRVYYDEAYYVTSAQALLAGRVNPNPEAPPLGKLLIAGGIEVFGDNALGWRAPSAICGALTIVAVFAWTQILLGDLGLALTAAVLAFFSNFTFVMSRVAMMDASLVAFAIWSVVVYTAALRLEWSAVARRLLLCCAGVLAGLATACKWNGVDTLAVLLLMSFAWPWLAKKGKTDEQGSLAQYARGVREIGMGWVLAALLLFPAVAYSLTYWPLCRSVHLRFGIRQLVKMNLYIWHFHRAVVSNPAITSAWYTWPLKLEPQRALSYLLGNPVVMWSGLLAILYCVWRLRKSFGAAEGFVTILYAANVLQWAVTPQNGILYYYYYPSAMILCVALAVGLRNAPERVFGVRLRLILLVAAGAIFLWCLPRMAHLGAPWDCALGCWS